LLNCSKSGLQGLELISIQVNDGGIRFAMLVTTIALTAVVLAQQPAQAPKPEITVLKAGLGTCSVDFIVNDSDGKPVYAATIHVRVRYGLWGIKRADLEVGTNSDGQARIEGLPAKARPLTYDIQKAGKKAAVEQNVSDNCRANYEVTLK
jgi:hypothetical protein